MAKIKVKQIDGLPQAFPVKVVDGVVSFTPSAPATDGTYLNLDDYTIQEVVSGSGTVVDTLEDGDVVSNKAATDMAEYLKQFDGTELKELSMGLNVVTGDATITTLNTIPDLPVAPLDVEDVLIIVNGQSFITTPASKFSVSGTAVTYTKDPTDFDIESGDSVQYKYEA